MEQANTDNPTPRRPQRPMRPLLIAAAVVLALLVGGLVFFAVRAGRAYIETVWGCGYKWVS